MKNISELICETVEICKSSRSDVVPANIVDLKNTASRLEEQFKASQSAQEKEIRNSNVILHKLLENSSTNEEVLAIASDMSMHSSCITNITRLGTRNMKLSPTEKLRPVKITFNNPLNAREFMKRFRDYSDKQGTFVTLDLSKEDGQKEYQLRQERNKLSSQFTANKYQIRQGKIFVRESGTNVWKLAVQTVTSNSTDTGRSSVTQV